MRSFKAEIIAIGTELLLGQIPNTNAQWISEKFALQGIDTYYHTVVGDNLMRVESIFKQAHERSNVIIVSGGLGPTEDDMTREAFQSLSKLSLIEHTPTIKKIENYFKKQERKMTPNNSKQARVFEGAEVIDNTVGMAPGMFVDYEDRLWVFVPGVPKEMKQMIQDTVLPYLMEKTEEPMIIQSMILHFIGIGEAQLEHELQKLIQSQENPTIAPLAQEDGLIVRLTAKAQSVEHARTLLNNTKEAINARVGDHIVGIDDETIEEKVYMLLKDQKKQISAAESITGGMFTEKLISIEGASEICPGGIISYDTKVKENILHISPSLIKTHGVVSEACAIAMAKNVRKQLNTDLGISFTGVAGPKSLEGHDVGTVFIAINSSEGEELVEKWHFQGNRSAIRRRAMFKGFEMLFNYLKKRK